MWRSLVEEVVEQLQGGFVFFLRLSVCAFFFGRSVGGFFLAARGKPHLVALRDFEEHTAVRQHYGRASQLGVETRVVQQEEIPQEQYPCGMESGENRHDSPQVIDGFVVQFLGMGNKMGNVHGQEIQR